MMETPLQGSPASCHSVYLPTSHNRSFNSMKTSHLCVTRAESHKWTLGTSQPYYRSHCSSISQWGWLLAKNLHALLTEKTVEAPGTCNLWPNGVLEPSHFPSPVNYLPLVATIVASLSPIVSEKRRKVKIKSRKQLKQLFIYCFIYSLRQLFLPYCWNVSAFSDLAS